jgi:hypothetical protein
VCVSKAAWGQDRTLDSYLIFFFARILKNQTERKKEALARLVLSQRSECIFSFNLLPLSKSFSPSNFTIDIMTVSRAMPLLRQARVATGSIRAPSVRTMKSQIRMKSSSASSPSSSSSSSSSGITQGLAPFALAVTFAIGGFTYSSSVLSMESGKRKSYAERMAIEKKVAEVKQAQAAEEQNEEQEESAKASGADEGMSGTR